MGNAFLAFGFLVSLLFSYATYTGYSAWDSMGSGNWGAQGQQQHGFYHK